MTNIYCISGLGADERIFKKLHIKGAKLIHLPWPEYDVYDEMGCYAQKIAALIKEDNPIILGISFGGMMAVEISKLVPVKQLFLISTAKTAAELTSPGWVVKKLLVSEVLPGFVYKSPNKVMLSLFGAETDEEKDLLRAILKDSDGQFMRWAMRAIMLWQNAYVPQNATHIHGTGDNIILPANVEPDYWIEDGTHMMIYKRADEIAAIIEKELSQKAIHVDNANTY